MQENYYTLTAKLLDVTNKTPDKVALQIKKSHGYEKYTYQELLNNSIIIGQALVNLGVQKQDKVAIVLENCPQWAFIYFGVLFAKAVAVPLDPHATVIDLKYYLDNSESKVAFVSLAIESMFNTLIENNSSLQKIIVLDKEKPKKATKKILTFSEILKGSPQLLADRKNELDDLASIVYTSGTTGRPKGVMLTHKNFYANFHSIEKLNIFNFPFNLLAVLPLHHTFPFMVTLLIPIFTQNTITYVSSNTSGEITKCMQETGVSIFVGVPQFFYMFYQAILREFNKTPVFKRIILLGLTNLLYRFRQVTNINLSKLLLIKLHSSFGQQLKYLVSGGAKLDTEVEKFFNKIGFTLISGYGLSETSPIATLNPIKKIKIGSAGVAIPDVNIRISEPDKSGVGEIVISGPNIMQGYYKNLQETRAALNNGWFYSGDLGYLDKQGYLFITGRKKELIILGSGKNISPEEIESYYLASRYIKELCVLAIGEGIKEKLSAIIVPDFEYFKATGNIDIINTIKTELNKFSKELPSHKKIQGFIITKQQLPRTVLGKLKRHEIQAQHFEQLMTNKFAVYQAQMTQADESDTIHPEVYNKVINTIKETKQLKTSIHLNTHLYLDLEFDSLSLLEFIASLENSFSITIPKMLITRISTVKELMLAVDELLTAKKTTHPRTRSHNKKFSWDDLLNTNPNKTITNKLDISPSWLAKITYKLFCLTLYIIRLIWRVKVIGAKDLPKNCPLILCPNHTSYLDGFLILTAMPSWLKLNIFFLAYSAYFEVPIIRNIVKIGRVIPINPVVNLLDAMQACGYVLRHGKSVCIFAEGERSLDGTIGEFKKGIGILAQCLNTKIVPVYIDGAYNVLPRGKSFPRFNSIKITFGAPFTPEQLKAKGNSMGIKDPLEAIAKGVQLEVNKLKG